MNRDAKTTEKINDWESIRDDFPVLKQKINGHPLVYLDNAASSQKPQIVIDAVRNHYVYDNANVHRGIHELSNRSTETYEGARKRIYAGADDECFEKVCTASAPFARAWK